MSVDEQIFCRGASKHLASRYLDAQNIPKKTPSQEVPGNWKMRVHFGNLQLF